MPRTASLPLEKSVGAKLAEAKNQLAAVERERRELDLRERELRAIRETLESLLPRNGEAPAASMTKTRTKRTRAATAPPPVRRSKRSRTSTRPAPGTRKRGRPRKAAAASKRGAAASGSMLAMAGNLPVPKPSKELAATIKRLQTEGKLPKAKAQISAIISAFPGRGFRPRDIRAIGKLCGVDINPDSVSSTLYDLMKSGFVQRKDGRYFGAVAKAA